MKKILTLLLLIAPFALSGLKAQDTTTTWLNTLGEKVDKEKAPFYQLSWEKNGKWQTHLNFRFGSLRESGAYIDSSCTIKSGEFIRYNKDGVKTAELHFDANRYIGPYAEWYDDGTVSVKGTFSESEIIKETSAAADDYWNPEEASEIIPAEEEGVRIGRWEFYHPNDQLSAAYEYDDYGYLIASKFWQADGSLDAGGSAMETLPEFPGGIGELMKFLGEHVKYPPADKNAGRSGEVMISFLVDRNGEVKDHRIERSVSRTMDAECVRLLTLMPKWVPGKNNNRIAETRYFLPIRFTNVTARGHKEMLKKIEGR